MTVDTQPELNEEKSSEKIIEKIAVLVWVQASVFLCSGGSRRCGVSHWRQRPTVRPHKSGAGFDPLVL